MYGGVLRVQFEALALEVLDGPSIFLERLGQRIAEGRQATVLLPEGQERATDRMTRLGKIPGTDVDAPRDLPIAFPKRQLVGDPRIIHGGLHVAGCVDGARGDGVLAGRGLIPVQAPDLPGVLTVVMLLTCRSSQAPSSIRTSTRAIGAP